MVETLLPLPGQGAWESTERQAWCRWCNWKHAYLKNNCESEREREGWEGGRRRVRMRTMEAKALGLSQPFSVTQPLQQYHTFLCFLHSSRSYNPTIEIYEAMRIILLQITTFHYLPIMSSGPYNQAKYIFFQSEKSLTSMSNLHSLKSVVQNCFWDSRQSSNCIFTLWN